MAHNVTFKFAPGDTVFFMHENRIQEGEVKHTQFNQNSDGVTIKYSIVFPDSSKGDYPTIKQRIEEYVFSTKKDLLASL
tara:strand:- start:25450 stop:25686 length:237 start_codon:yes stop_codon:yes gene_type:complete